MMAIKYSVVFCLLCCFNHYCESYNYGDIFTCQSDLPLLIKVSGQSYIQWNHKYNGNDDSIRLPNLQAAHSTFSLTFENFDKNLVLYSEGIYHGILFQNLHFGTDCFKYGKTRVYADNYRSYDNVPILKFSDDKTLTFSCNEYSTPTNYVYIVLFRNSKILRTLYMNKFTMIYSKDLSGVMLCCMVFNVYDVGVEETNIKREVLKKTKLIYDPSQKKAVRQTNFDKPTTTKKMPPTTTTSTTPRTTTTSRTTSASTTSTDVDVDDPTKAIDTTDESTGLVLIIISVATVTLLILIIPIIICTKCCRTRSEPSKKPELNNIITPFYLNLLFRNECRQEIEAIEQHHYEEIE